MDITTVDKNVDRLARIVVERTQSCSAILFAEEIEDAVLRKAAERCGMSETELDGMAVPQIEKHEQLPHAYRDIMDELLSNLESDNVVSLSQWGQIDNALSRARRGTATKEKQAEYILSCAIRGFEEPKRGGKGRGKKNAKRSRPGASPSARSASNVRHVDPMGAAALAQATTRTPAAKRRRVSSAAHESAAGPSGGVPVVVDDADDFLGMPSWPTTAARGTQGGGGPGASVAAFPPGTSERPAAQSLHQSAVRRAEEEERAARRREQERVDAERRRKEEEERRMAEVRQAREQQQRREEEEKAAMERTRELAMRSQEEKAKREMEDEEDEEEEDEEYAGMVDDPFA